VKLYQLKSSDGVTQTVNWTTLDRSEPITERSALLAAVATAIALDVTLATLLYALDSCAGDSRTDADRHVAG
jgi:hypothetical protein